MRRAQGLSAATLPWEGSTIFVSNNPRCDPIALRLVPTELSLKLFSRTRSDLYCDPFDRLFAQFCQQQQQRRGGGLGYKPLSVDRAPLSLPSPTTTQLSSPSPLSILFELGIVTTADVVPSPRPLSCLALRTPVLHMDSSHRRKTRGTVSRSSNTSTGTRPLPWRPRRCSSRPSPNLTASTRRAGAASSPPLTATR